MTMTPDTSKWRSSPIYDYVDDLAAAGQAWEWLRRNSDYQRDYRDFSQAAESQLSPLMEKTRSHWGLRFPGFSGA